MSTYDDLIALGARPYQAKYKAKLIDNYKEGDVLSDGRNYRLYVSAGIPPIEALKQEVYDWAEWDKLYPPTPFERAMTAHAEGGRKTDYIAGFAMTFRDVMKKI